MNNEQLLKEYNCWRRGYSGYEMPNPTEIGIAIDSVIAQLAALKEENERLKDRVAELETQRDHLQRLLALAIEEREALGHGERDE